jgi:myosin heavy subunit
MKEDEIDFLLLSHNYPEVAAFLEKMQAEVASKKPKDRYAVRVQELQTTLTEKEQENAKLRRRLRAMEESLERRDNDRAVLDKDVDAALQETAGTVQDLYEALQAAQQDTEAAHKALAVRASQTRALEQAKEAALEAAAAAERAYQQEIAKLNEQLAQAQADVSKAKESVTQAMLQAQSEEKAEPRVALFSFVVPLATASAQRAAAAVLKDSQQTRVLHALALAYAGRTGGAIPVQVKSCVVSDDGAASSSSIPPAVLQITVELAYYANARTADAAQAEVGRKLQEGGSCTSVQEYLRMRSEAARREATAAADAQRAVSEADQRAAAAIAAMRAESQRTSETKPEAAASQLQEINAKVASVVVPPSSSSSSSDSGKATASVVGRVDQLIIRLTTAEAAARRYEEEKQHASRRLAEAQQEREQLQQTLTELTTRCTEVRVAKEQLASRLACAEEQLKAAQAAAGESQSVLSERVKRLESALRAKTAAAEAEKEAAAEGLKVAVAAAAAERVAESEEMLKAKEREIQRLQTKLAAATAAAASLSKASSGDEAALREALKTAKEDRTALARQVKEMETDMNDLSNIQAAMQRELESAQQELRAKKHDFDLLVKQLIRMEEREKKWQLESHTQQQQQPNSPDSPSRQQQQSEEAEKDDVARESLVVLTNSNKSLQQCLRKLQRTMHSMGMAVRLSSSAAAAAGGAASFSSTMEGNDSGRGTRRSGHRKGALAATVSRAANDHHQLSAQLSELLLAMLDELETGKNQHHQARSSGNDDASNSATRGVKTNIGPTGSGAAFTRTASYHCNPHHQQTSSGAGAASRIVKQHLSNSPFARTRSTPVLVERVSQGTNDPSTPQHTSKPETRDVDVAAAATSSGVKATVDAAPRLEFFRQTSSRAYTRSNTTATAVAAALTDGSDNTNGAALLPTSAAASSSGGAEKEQEKERRSREQPQRRTGSGASTSGVSHVNAARRHAPSSTTTTTTKSNPFRRSNTATAGTSGGSSAASAAAMNSSSAAAASGNANFVRMPSGYRCMPTNTAEAGASTHKPYRMRF